MKNHEVDFCTAFSKILIYCDLRRSVLTIGKSSKIYRTLLIYLKNSNHFPIFYYNIVYYF